jgi:RNA polymerase sigma factor (TIGR02999 family)
MDYQASTIVNIRMGLAMAKKSETPEAVTELLHRWSRGEDGALDQLIPLVYPELKRIAAYQMRGERREHTLQPTALANEAYLKLAHGSDAKWESRAHFLAVAARAMRQVLVDYARSRKRIKRDVVLVPLDGVNILAAERPVEFLLLDSALENLTTEDVRKARVLELRIFGGLTNPEIAKVMGFSVASAERDYKVAIALLHRMITGKNEALRKSKTAS